MRIPGLKTVDRAARALRTRLVGGALILGYHRVAEIGWDPFEIGVSPKHFREHLEVLRRTAHPLSLKALVGGLATGLVPRRAVVVTFDDGYADLLRGAKPALEELEIPSTVFAIAGALGAEFWWDELARALGPGVALPEQLASDLISPTDLAAAQRGDLSRKRLVLAVYRRLLSVADDPRRDHLEALRADDAAAATPAPARALDAEGLRRLTQGGLIDVGGHSVTHRFLAELPELQQREELIDCKTMLEQILASPVNSFSYPNGSFSDVTRRLAREAGYQCACSSRNDSTGRRSDPFALPRFWPGDWDGDAFARFLRRWLG